MAPSTTLAGTSVPSFSSDLGALVTTWSWPSGGRIHRIHPDRFGATRFNDSGTGNARFSPIGDAAGSTIPTIYGGTTFECAAMETVFHDVPFAPGLKTLGKSKLTGHAYSVVQPVRDLALADLSSTALRNLGLRRGDLIDTEKDQYPGTRLWAEAIHSTCPAVEGLCWVSRQDDRALAIVLFGDRVAAGDLTQVDVSRDVADDVSVYADLLRLASRIGVNVV